MRYWTRAPEPGSFQEEVALAVLAFEEFRTFEYVSATIVAQQYAQLQSEKSFEATMKMVNALQDKFFGGESVDEDGNKKIDSEDKDEFLDLMENTFAVVHGDRLKQAAAKEHQQAVPEGKPLIYNENPRGELLE